MPNTEKDYTRNGLPCFTGEENYWIISSGKEQDLYSYFHEKKIIGLAWDKLKSLDVHEKSLDNIKEIVKEKYNFLKGNYKEDSGFSRASTIFSKELNFFVNEMEKGDIVVVKDRSRSKLMFGRIISSSYDDNENIHSENLKIDDDRGNCNKFRDIEWLNIMEKEKVSELIKNNIINQQAITKVNNTKVVNEINKTIFSLFYNKDVLHAIFNVKQDSNIEFNKYFSFLTLINDYKKEKEITKDFYIKSNVSSPGPIEIFGCAFEIQELLKYLGLLGTAVGTLGAVKYLKSKEDLNMVDPGSNDGYGRGN